MVVHGVTLKPGFARVSIDFVSDKYRDLALPEPTEEFKTLGDAKDSTVMWPESWIELVEKVYMYF